MLARVCQNFNKKNKNPTNIVLSSIILFDYTAHQFSQIMLVDMNFALNIVNNKLTNKLVKNKKKYILNVELKTS